MFDYELTNALNKFSHYKLDTRFIEFRKNSINLVSYIYIYSKLKENAIFESNFIKNRKAYDKLEKIEQLVSSKLKRFFNK